MNYLELRELAANAKDAQLRTLYDRVARNYSYPVDVQIYSPTLEFLGHPDLSYRSKDPAAPFLDVIAEHKSSLYKGDTRE